MCSCGSALSCGVGDALESSVVIVESELSANAAEARAPRAHLATLSVGDLVSSLGRLVSAPPMPLLLPLVATNDGMRYSPDERNKMVEKVLECRYLDRD